MRHNNKGRKLGRTASHRKATLEAISTALLKNKRIKTTVAKAKEARSFVEPLITRAKENSVFAKRHVAKFIKDKEVVKELFTEIVPKIGERPGGYTRVVKLGRRLGDAAEVAILELVDYNEVANIRAAEKKEKKEEKKQKAEKEKAEQVPAPATETA
jgi:large subunit ribosomal protein L17